MMTRASFYGELGDYTEALPIYFNDVDYCLRAERAGYSVVYAPQAELIHYESMSRKREVYAYEIEYFEKRWARFVTDPYYNESMLRNQNPNYDIVLSGKPIG